MFHEPAGDDPSHRSCCTDAQVEGSADQHQHHAERENALEGHVANDRSEVVERGELSPRHWKENAERNENQHEQHDQTKLARDIESASRKMWEFFSASPIG